MRIAFSKKFKAITNNSAKLQALLSGMTLQGKWLQKYLHPDELDLSSRLATGLGMSHLVSVGLLGRGNNCRTQGSSSFN